MNEKVLSLIRPEATLREAFLDMMDDWRHVGDDRYEPVRECVETDFAGLVEEWLALAERTGTSPETWPQHIYWLLRDTGEPMHGQAGFPSRPQVVQRVPVGKPTPPANVRILGTITLRPQLPEKVQRTFGHIGYEVRPSERRKGRATWMLTHVLPKARDLGLDHAMLVCTKGHPSTRVIRKNGGVLDGEFFSTKLDMTCQTWRIDL